MAAKIPATVGTVGFVDADRGLYTVQGASTVVTLTTGTYIDNRNAYIQKLHYFADVDDGDTWASGIAGIKACFWQPDQGSVDAVCATANAAGLVTFETTAISDLNGWLLIFIDPVVNPGISGLRGI